MKRVDKIRFLLAALSVANLVGILLYFSRESSSITETSYNGQQLEDDAYNRPNPGATAYWKSTTGSSRSSMINTTKIVGFSDNVYKPVALRWYRRLEALGYTTHVVVTNDDEAASFFEQEGIRYDRLTDHITTNVSDFYQCAFKENAKVTYNKRKQNYRRHLFASRWHYIARQLQYNKTNILLTDVDNIFNRYQDLTEFENSPFDVYHAFEGFVPSFPRNMFKFHGFTICGGMSWLRSTPSVIQFVKHITTRCNCDNETVIDCACRCDDQQVLNSIVLRPQEKARYIWDQPDYIPSNWDEQSWDSVTGVNKMTGHRVKVWDRHTAYRGDINPNRCPRNNWISMPSQLVNKSSLADLWDEACGPGRGNKSWEPNENATKKVQVEEAVYLEPWYQRLYDSVEGTNTKLTSQNRVPKTTKIVGFADKFSLIAAAEWYRRLQAVGYTSHVVVAYDPATTEFLSKEGIPYEPIGPFSRILSFENCWSKNAKLGKVYRTRVDAARWNYILRQLANGTHVLVTDTHSNLTIHRHVPMSEFETSEYDAYHAYMGGIPSPPFYYFNNIGFTLLTPMSWLRSTPSVIDFARQMASECNCEYELLQCDCKCEDQRVFNQLLLTKTSNYQITWSSATPSPPKSYDAQSWDSMTGVCNTTGHRVKIWDRHTVFHGSLENLPLDKVTGRRKCPQQNWIAILTGSDQNWNASCGSGDDGIVWQW